jgi:hypothetical protein
MRSHLAVPVALLSCLAVAAPASAASWAKVTSDTMTPADQVAVLANPDDSTSVAWNGRTSPGTQSLFVTKVSGTAKVGATATVASDWVTLSNPALAAGPAGAGTRVFFGGMHTTTTGDPNSDLNDAVSNDGGATWAVDPASIVAPGNQAYGSPAAAVFAGGGFQEAWAATLGLFTHNGLAPTTPTVTHGATQAQSPYYAGLATDGNNLNLAWYSNHSGAAGVYEQDVAADGTEQSGPAVMPGTAGMTIGQSARTPIVSVSGEKWLAYPTGTTKLDKIRVWRVAGGGKSAVSTTVGHSSTNSYATITSTADGRLWVAWTDITGGDATTYARRSNAKRTVWGETVEAGAPKNASGAYAVDGAATGGSELNLFTAFGIGTAQGTATYVTHVLPGLTLERDSGSLTKGDEHTLSFKVTDAGDPVAKATVKLGGDSATTNSKGIAELQVTGHGSKMTATATASHYTGTDLDLKVRR